MTPLSLAPLSLPAQIGLVFKRTMGDGIRNFPLAFVAPMMLAAFTAVIFGAVFNSVADTPGFPTDTFLQWVTPASVLLTAFVGAGYAASALLRDIETGYLDRLRLLPINPAAIVIARALFEGVRAIPTAALVLGGALLFGADNGNGVIGFVAILAITAIVAIAWNGVFFLVALKTRNQQAVLGLQPLFMPIIMFSTFFGPTTSAPRWFDAIATFNPFTQLLDGTRSILANDTNTQQLVTGLAAFTAIGLVTYAMAGRVFAGIAQPD